MVQKTLHELADFVDGTLVGDSHLVIRGVNDIVHAREGHITFLASAMRESALDGCQATAVISDRILEKNVLPTIVVADPVLAFARIHALFLERAFEAQGISPQASIGEGCSIPQEVSIGARCVVGDRVRIGRRVRLFPGVVLGDDVSINDGSVLYPNVVVYDGCTLGKRVVVHAGSIIGADGFGYATDTQGCHVKRPHVGSVVIENDVEIGANVCVDRATFGETRIGAGSKIDNLVQVAHNVHIEENALLVAQCGIAGSSSLGRNVVLGGQVGVAGHVHLGDRVMVGAQSGVHNSQKAGTVVSGTPAFTHKKWLRASLALEKLPDLLKDVRSIKKQIENVSAERNEEEK